MHSYLDLIDKLEGLGYIVKEFRVNGSVEFHAIPRDGSSPQVARCNDGDDDAAALKAIDLLLTTIVMDVDGI